MKKNNKTQQNKYCPLADKLCMKEGCSLFNELLTNCEISVLSYNLYRYSEAMKQKNENKE